MGTVFSRHRLRPRLAQRRAPRPRLDRRLRVERRQRRRPVGRGRTGRCWLDDLSRSQLQRPTGSWRAQHRDGHRWRLFVHGPRGRHVCRAAGAAGRLGADIPRSRGSQRAECFVVVDRAAPAGERPGLHARPPPTAEAIRAQRSAVHEPVAPPQHGAAGGHRRRRRPARGGVGRGEGLGCGDRHRRRRAAIHTPRSGPRLSGRPELRLQLQRRRPDARHGRRPRHGGSGRGRRPRRQQHRRIGLGPECLPRRPAIDLAHHHRPTRGERPHLQATGHRDLFE